MATFDIKLDSDHTWSLSLFCLSFMRCLCGEFPKNVSEGIHTIYLTNFANFPTSRNSKVDQESFEA